MQVAKVPSGLLASPARSYSIRLASRPVPARMLKPTPYHARYTRNNIACASVNSSPSVLPSPLETTSTQSAATSLAKLAATFGAAMAVALIASDPAAAANTGGRVGGSNFSGRQSSYNSQSSSVSRSTSVSHTTVIVSQPTPMFGFMPIGFMPLGMGFGYHSPASTIMSLLALVLVLFIIVQVISMFWGSKEEEEYYEADPPVTVVKLQLGLLGLAKNVRAQLDSLALRADTSTPEGLHFILQETVLALMRHPDYFVYAASSAETVQDDSEAERRFNSLSLSERAKIRQETLSNVSGYTSASFNTAGSNGVNELILVTIMLAAEGQVVLPPINSAADAREALSKLGGIPPSSIMGVELLWTPQAPGDTLTQTQLLADYPQLVPV